MAPASQPAESTIDALEFDPDRPRRSNSSRESHRRLLDDDVDFMGEVAEDILQRDRRRMRVEFIRIASFVCAVLCCLCAGSITAFSLYGGRFLTDLHYSQYRVNAVSIVAELAMYLPVPIYGALCDRYSPPPLALLSTFQFGLGYLLAAFTYKAGPPPDAVEGGKGWPFGVMVLAFVGIGSGTSCMYLASVATCAKNFATSKYRGFMLALPIAAFGLSGMWQSQVGAHLLKERRPDGSTDVDVFRYFLFLAGLLIAAGLLGVVALRIVDEEELIERGVEQLERSGLLEESDFFRAANGRHRNQHYGTMHDADADTESDSASDLDLTLSESMILKKQQEEALLRRKKLWLLNHETHSFLTDRTMWLLAAGFFLVTGPGEAYINNVGTIIPTLTPKHWSGSAWPPAGKASSHVSVIALTSTIARLVTGTLSDLFAPTSESAQSPNDGGVSFSRLVLLLPSASLLLVAFLTLTIPALVPEHPSSFLASSALVGLGYGASFSLVPIIISVVWGPENFATNWGVVAMVPAAGAALWSLVYSAGYSRAATGEQCHGLACFQAWAGGCVASVAVALVLWGLAWRAWSRRNVVV